MDTFAGVNQLMQYGVGQWLRCVAVGSQKEEGYGDMKDGSWQVLLSNRRYKISTSSL